MNNFFKQNKKNIEMEWNKDKNKWEFKIIDNKIKIKQTKILIKRDIIKP